MIAVAVVIVGAAVILRSVVSDSGPEKIRFPVKWTLFSASPESTVVVLDMRASKCADGSPVQNRLERTDITYTPDQITIAVTAYITVEGHSCPQPVPDRVTVQLKEPVGNRVVLDGNATAVDVPGRLLEELCTELDLCVSPGDMRHIEEVAPKSPEAFLDAVLAAEGTDATRIDPTFRDAVLDVVEPYFAVPPLPQGKARGRFIELRGSTAVFDAVCGLVEGPDDVIVTGRHTVPLEAASIGVASNPADVSRGHVDDIRFSSMTDEARRALLLNNGWWVVYVTATGVHASNGPTDLAPC